jgi:hypothetical protein
MQSKTPLIILILGSLLQLSLQLPLSPISDAYESCKDGSSRCFGMPEGCISTSNCDVLLATTPSSGQVNFKLFWTTAGGQDKWVAAGLSPDGKMGNAALVQCIRNPTKVDMKNGITVLSKSFVGIKQVGDVSGVTMNKWKYSGDDLSCEWTRSDQTTVDGKSFDLTSEFYIILAHGPVDENGIKDALII